MVVCSACGAQCAEGSRFCSACGAAISVREAGPERRLVTVVFCDLVGSTSLGERADAEDVDAFLRAFGAMVAEVAASFGGVVEKYIGDAAVAVFGVPVAHEDDAERAVRAGLRIVERIPELPVVGDAPLRVRVGIETGRAVIRRGVDPTSGQGFMVGDAINTAARLQGIAPPMGIVAGAATHALTSGLFAFERIADVHLKGKAAPADVWLVRHPLTRTGVEARRLSSEFVGRERELATLTRHLDDISAGGPPRMVLLAGEAGIGKSRLVYEVARHAEASTTLFRWRTGECPPFGQITPYAALSQIVRSHAAILESDDAAEVARKLDSMLDESSDGPWLAARLRPLLGLDAPAASPEENAAAWERVLEVMAGRGPLVLVFEDLQWADDGLLRWLGGVIDHIGDVPLLVLGVARPELLERAPDFGVGPAASRLMISSLDGADLDLLAATTLDHAELSADLGDQVRERCGGNPLFVEEFVRYLAEARPGGREVRFATALVPETLEALIAARLDALADDPRALLGDGAVVGQEFWRGAVAAMETSFPGDIDAALQILTERQLARPLPVSTVSGEVEYMFHHAMVRDVAYSRLPRAVRATKHAQVAEWLEAALGDRPDEMTGALAHHWVTALELSRAAHQEGLAAATLGPAVRSLVRAGDHALALNVSIAESQYGQALELAAPDDSQRPELIVRWARALLEAGRIGEAVGAFEEGVDGLRRQDDAVATALAVSDYSTALQLLGDMDGSQALLEEALELLGDDRTVAKIQVLARWSLHSTIMADDDGAIRAGNAALDLAAELGVATPSAL